jgi:putative DNA primase/helicase
MTTSTPTVPDHLLWQRLTAKGLKCGLPGGKKFLAQCPIHTGLTYSLSISSKAGNATITKTLCGCTQQDVLDALNITPTVIAKAGLSEDEKHEDLQASEHGPTPPTRAAAGDPQAHRGQVRIAYRLADVYAGQLMHVHGMGWFHWTGRRWAEDDQGAAARAVLAVLRDALIDSLNDGQRDLREDVRKCESNAGISGVLSIASALKQFAFTVDDLDKDPYLLNCANGTLDLHTYQLRPHSPSDRLTKVTAAAYNPNAQGPLWQAFLARVLPDESVRGFLQRYIGLSLAGRVLEHLLAILTGTGRNGKGVLYGAVAQALGDYAITAEPDLFMHREGAHPTGEMDLLGVRFVVVSESEQGRKLAEATVKRLTGGDRMRARRMRQDYVQFQPSHTAALVTNHLPKVSGNDSALWARLRVVPFDVVIPEAEQDSHLPERLELEAEAVLSWAVAGWVAYQAAGMAEPDAVKVATEHYRTDSDAVARFLLECTQPNPHAHTATGELFERWTRWAAEDGTPPMSAKALGQELGRRGYTEGRTMHGRHRKGLLLLTEDSEEGEPNGWNIAP